jgi:metallophosphoesterase superfamily enzyme
VEGRLWNGVSLLHSPPNDFSRATLCGHLHPGVVWKGLGGVSLRLPCFWVCGQVCCLPAFGSFTGLHIVRAKQGDNFWPVAENRVFEMAR